MKLTVILLVSCALGMIGKGTGRLGNKGTSGNHPVYSINYIGQNTEKNPGDLRGLAVS